MRFELDPRIELLSAAVRLARPKAADAARLKLAYDAAARKRLAPFAKHPALSALDRLLKRGVPEYLFAELILEQPDPKKLEADPHASRGALTQAGGEAELHAFFAALRDLSAKADFPGFLREQKAAHAEFRALARAEAARAQPPEDLAAYLRAPFSGTFRLVLAPLLPGRYYVNVSRGGLEQRVRSGVAGRNGLTFEYDAFDTSVAHELVHTALTPLMEASRAEFESYAGRPPEDCNDPGSWAGCVEEHLVRALTLRALKAAKGDAAYRKLLKSNVADGYPFLADLCSKLEGYEASGEPFSSYYPRLLAACRNPETGAFGIVRMKIA